MTSWWRSTGRRRLALYVGLDEPTDQERLAARRRSTQVLAFIVTMVVVALVVHLTH